jgi:hypothetical protein
MERLYEASVINKTLTQAVKLFDSLIDEAVNGLTILKKKFQEKIHKILEWMYKYAPLRQKLLTGQQPSTKEMTGNSMIGMLNELRECK